MITLNTKTKVVIVLVAIATSFALGRYSVQQPPKVETHVDTQIDTTTHKDEDKHTHSQTTVTEQPGGVKTTVTVVDEDTTTKTDRTKDTDTRVDQAVTPSVRKTLNISAMAGLEATKSFIPLYGIAVTKEVFGPVTVGAWGLTNGTVGISVGVSF